MPPLCSSEYAQKYQFVCGIFNTEKNCKEISLVYKNDAIKEWHKTNRATALESSSGHGTVSLSLPAILSTRQLYPSLPLPFQSFSSKHWHTGRLY